MATIALDTFPQERFRRCEIALGPGLSELEAAVPETAVPESTGPATTTPG